MVTTEGKVVVTLPRGATRESLARALEKHRAWIERRGGGKAGGLGASSRQGKPTSWEQPYRLDGGWGTQREPYP